MRTYEFLTEGKNYPIICVDVQPEYSKSEPDKLEQIKAFVLSQTGPVLMFVNTEDRGTASDTMHDIMAYWEEGLYSEEDDSVDLDWNRFSIVDKGYGHFRAWMDSGIPESTIIKTIRLLYRERKNDIRNLFGGEGSDEYVKLFKEYVGEEYRPYLESEVFSVNWTSVAQLKKFSGAYIVGGGRNECLREVELLMNAFNIKYKRINHLVYG